MTPQSRAPGPPAESPAAPRGAGRGQAVSGPRGARGNGRYTVLVDPIDGSQNAERGIPYFCLCVAIAEGDTVGDVFFGYVYDFGANEEWHAIHGGGAFLDGKPL